jgi:hypothetical protein
VTGFRTSVGDGSRVALVLGPSDDLRAEVFIRVWLPQGVAAARLEGTLVGPRCRRASTLPAEARLAAIAPAPGVAAALARTVLTEPSYWTPDLPNLYRLEARLADGDRTVATFELMVGLRRLGVRGRSFWLDGRRWVPRGVACVAETCDAEALRAACLAATVVDPPADLCAAADAIGVPIIGVLEAASGTPLNPRTAADRIASWALHPSVVLAVVPSAVTGEGAAAIAAAARGLKGTLLIGQAVDGSEPPPSAVPEGIEYLVVRLASDVLPHDAWRIAAPALPLMAWRPGSVGQGSDRRGCDTLQADLAAWALAGGTARPAWDWAGYVLA